MAFEYYEHNDTAYRVQLVAGTDWRDTSRDQVMRWNPEQHRWMESVMSACRIRSYGEPIIAPEECIWLDWVNNYLTVEVMAEHYGLGPTAMKQLLDEGKRLHLCTSPE